MWRRQRLLPIVCANEALETLRSRAKPKDARNNLKVFNVNLIGNGWASSMPIFCFVYLHLVAWCLRVHGGDVVCLHQRLPSLNISTIMNADALATTKLRSMYFIHETFRSNIDGWFPFAVPKTTRDCSCFCDFFLAASIVSEEDAVIIWHRARIFCILVGCAPTPNYCRAAKR